MTFLLSAPPRSRSTVSFVWTGSCGDAAHTLSQIAYTLAFRGRAFEWAFALRCFGVGNPSRTAR